MVVLVSALSLLAVFRSIAIPIQAAVMNLLSVTASLGVLVAGRVITAAATIMLVVFLSFVISDARVLKVFGPALASAVFLDAFVVRNLLLPSVLQLLGRHTWRLPTVIDRRLPRLAIDAPQGAQP